MDSARVLRLVADRFWLDPQVGALLRSDRPRDAAVAYVGAAAVDLLGLRAGDTVTFDGSDRALRAGTVDPAAVAAWLEVGVRARSLEGLHAKVLLFRGDAPHVAVVGSANASAKSRDGLHEAAVATDDPTVVAGVEQQLLLWTGTAVDAAWLARARRLYRPPTFRPHAPREARLPLPTDTVWVSEVAGEPVDAPEEAVRVHQDLVARNADPYLEVHDWTVHPSDAGRLLPDHWAVLVNATGGPEPHGNARAYAPALVAAVTVVAGHPPVAHLVADRRLRPLRWAAVRAAIRGAGAVHSWDHPLPSGPAAAAVAALWAPQPKAARAADDRDVPLNG